jgi:hypothetical protein
MRAAADRLGQNCFGYERAGASPPCQPRDDEINRNSHQLGVGKVYRQKVGLSPLIGCFPKPMSGHSNDLLGCT